MNARTPATMPVDALTDRLDHGQVEMDRHREDVRAWMTEEAARLRNGVTVAIHAPLLAVLDEAARRHRALPPVPGEPQALADALRAYHEAVREDILDPIRSFLEEERPGEALGTLATTSVERGLDVAATLPESLVIPEPEGLLQPDAADPLGLRLRRARLRTGRRWAARRRRMRNGLRRLIGRDALDARPPSHPVPLQQLVRTHIEWNWAEAHLDAFEQVAEALAFRLARLEVAMLAWTHGLLRLDAELTALSPEAPDEPLDGSSDEAMVRWRAEAERLQQALDEAAAPPDDPAPNPALAFDLDLLDGRLDDAVRRSGTLGLALPPQASPVTPAARLRTRAAAWTRWHDQFGDRLAFESGTLALRSALFAERRHLRVQLDEQGLAPLRQAIDDTREGLQALSAEAEVICTTPDSPADPLRPKLEALLERGSSLIEARLIGPLQNARLDGFAERLAMEAGDRRTRLLEALPEQLTLHSPTAERPIRADGPTYTVDPRRIVVDGLSDAFSERLQRIGQPLRQPLFRIVSEAETVLQVVVFNLEAALDEFDTTGGDPATARTNIEEFAVDGFARASERLATLAAPLEAPWSTVDATIRQLYSATWRLIHQRLEAADNGTGQFLDARTRALAALHRASRNARVLATEGLATSRRLLREGRTTASRLIRAGRTAAGLQAENERGRIQTLDALADVPALRAQLPLVYRRLFAFDPVTDPYLLEHRDGILEAISEAYARWRAGQFPTALVITGPSGSGRTSLLAVLRRTVFEDATPATVVLRDRLDSEQAFAERIAEALGIDVDGPPTLERLEAHLLAAPPDQRTRVCFVENLENLLLRAPGGSDLLERVAVFFSRTDGIVFWVATMVEPAWHFLERTEPQVTALAQRILLPDLDRIALEAVVRKRHARSGLPLVFDEPADLPPLTRRRLNAARTDDERQTLLSEVYFDRLFRDSGGHLQLALLYWLRSISFEREGATADTERLTVAPMQALDFSFIERFDLQRTFTLKALLQHGSLTLAEHDRVVRTTREESFLVFESLANQLLIERVETEPGEGRDRSPEPLGSISDTERYRIRPLLVSPVTRALKARNML